VASGIFQKTGIASHFFSFFFFSPSAPLLSRGFSFYPFLGLANAGPREMPFF